MTLAIGIASCDAVRAYGAPAVLKWPNDLLVNGRKLAGILVEAHSQGGRLDAVVVGIGVNLDRTPDTVAPIGISLAEASGTAVDRDAFVTDLLAHVERWIDRYAAGGLPAIVPAWQDRMASGLAARATVDGIQLTGAVCGLAEDGALVLRDHAGRLHCIRSGDIDALQSESSYV